VVGDMYVGMIAVASLPECIYRNSACNKVKIYVSSFHLQSYKTILAAVVKVASF
jgi:hypothetical protein